MSKEKLPKYKKGDKINNLTVLNYAGTVLYKGNLRKQHTYNCRCICGKERLVFQKYLSTTKHIHACEECVYERKLQHRKDQRKKNTGYVTTNHNFINAFWRTNGFK